MDSITRTARSAVVSYYNALRRMGNVHRQDKYHLMVLWLFHYLKNRSDFLYKWDGENFVVDRDTEKWLERKFRCNIPCLKDSSCFIKLLPDDNCVPILELTWDDDSEKDNNIRILVTNATYALQQNQIDADSADVVDLLNSMMLTNGSAVMCVNDNDNENTWLTTNDNTKTQL